MARRFADDLFRAVYGLTHADLIGLLGLLDDPQRCAAVEYDLISLGLRLRDVGTPGLSWGDVYTVVTQGGRASALFRVMNPDSHMWGLPEFLLAEIADTLRAANWQRGSGQRRDYPKPIPRPGIEPDSKTYGGDSLSLTDMAAWLGWTT